MSYEKDKIYVLRAPTDGLIEGDIVRFPVGLPVKFVEKKRDRFVVIEPKGKTVEFPLQYVWRLGRKDVDIFQAGYTENPERFVLTEYVNDETAQKQWDQYAHPEKFRWYIDPIREKFEKKVYSDWECGWSEWDIRYILQAATLRFVINGELQYPQEIIDIICDLALLIYSNDMPGWTEEVPPQVASEAAMVAVAAVEAMLSHNYFVQSGGTWSLTEKKFVHDELTITADAKEEILEKELPEESGQGGEE